MNTKKKRKLAKAGFKTGTVQDFLGLTDAEAAKVEERARAALAKKRPLAAAVKQASKSIAAGGGKKAKKR